MSSIALAANTPVPHDQVKHLTGGNPSGKVDSFGRPLHQMSARHKVKKPKTPSATSETTECPPKLGCSFVPAAYVQNSTPEDYSNYDIANRPSDGMAIRQIVIHDTEGSLSDTVAVFQDPMTYASAHYVVNTNGRVVQMVHVKDVAWHAGNYGTNMQSVGIEVVGHAATGDYTNAQYRAVSKLVSYLGQQYNVPMDAQHVIGHMNVPAPTAGYISTMHMDPGPFWNWSLVYNMIGHNVNSSDDPQTSQLVVVAPKWSQNKQLVTGCFPGTTSCVDDTRSSNLLYVHTEPSFDSPLVTDSVLGAGSTDIGNSAAKAYYGQKFVRLTSQTESKGIWFQIQYSGQSGWIFSPYKSPAVFAAQGDYITPAASSNIAVYGRAYPDPSIYPTDMLYYPGVVTLPYTVLAGQQYATASEAHSAQWYNNATYDYSWPHDHVVFADNDHQYVLIQYGSRQTYILLADVTA
jgi:N-acetyl-anhydromuramyl-L-alanine amidase AmpD